MSNFQKTAGEIISIVNKWETILLSLPVKTVIIPRNSQNRSVKEIVGHLVDSASNNTHRVVHLQYNTIPLEFPNYATFGNNDRWIAIQNYQNEDWENLIQLWKFSTIHFAHVIQQINPKKLMNEWISGEGENISLKKMVEYFPQHLILHLKEIEELINK